ncbi:HlyD family type I secretion periplasmic adaptor subunit [Ruegeria sediminis]|uniref:Membrane fusion protein (MFP) family protein n=1 Tax=Ruegeria sediminis TaxID=2583820 RepID=A0ABY2WXX2_9RHOB|nr:HlyD family type I secretion periplasmic adaptor subunit [Ruegeria sediminis]TMV07246.1 HlyD family type I secretion periplasmic adaptor subunit [Ruegeria sediminis]
MSKQKQIKTGLDRRERFIAISGVAGLLLLVVLFKVITIGSAVIAPGEVVVQGKPRPVQSLDGGIVREIHVRNGDRVEAGQVVMRLDPKLSEINRDIVRGRLAELVARRARLEAERQGLEAIPPVTDLTHLDAEAVGRNMDGQAEAFRSRRAVVDSRKAQLKEQIEQHEDQSTGIEAQIEATENQVALIRKEVGNVETLFKQGLVPESRLLELQGRQAGLLGQIAVHRSELSRLRNAIQDAELKITQADQEFHDEVVSELREVNAGIDENRLELARLDEGLNRLDIRAPVGGVVHELQVWTTGGVVAPQETLLTVVPVSDGVEFEVEVAPDSIDIVHVGQSARVRFPAFDQRSTPELTGAVSNVSPDSVTDPVTDRQFYRVQVSLPPEELARLGSSALIPGMPVEAFLQTGERSVLSFLLKPLTDQLTHAFRES